MSSGSSSPVSPRGGCRGLRRSARTRGGRRSRLTVYLTDAERQALELRARTTGEAMSKVLVDAALHPLGEGRPQGQAQVQEAAAALRDWRRQLVGVATNLNQITRHAHTVHEVPADLGRVVAEVGRLCDQVTEVLGGLRT